MAGARLNRSRWLRVIRNAALVLVVLVVVIGVAGFVIAPGIVKSVAVNAIAEQLGRKATIGSVKLNPYLLSATVGDFKLYEPDGTTVAAQIDEVVADVSSASLFKRALVFDELRITRPHLSIARLAPQRFSFSDIVDKILAKPRSESPFLFSLNNIRLEGGAIAFDDRVTGRKHLVENLRVGVPFISNLPYDTDIFVTPDFAARVNGSPIELTGKAQLFSNSREAAVELDIADLDLPSYTGFIPTQLRFKIASGKLAAKLALHFKAAFKGDKGQTIPQAIGVSGHVAVNELRLTDRNDKEVVTARAIEADITRLDPLRGDVALQRVAIAEPHVEATRTRDGSIDLIDLFTSAKIAPPASNPAPTTQGAAKPKPEPRAESSPRAAISIASLKLDNGSLRFTDQTLAIPANGSIVTLLRNIRVEAGAFDLQGNAPTTYDVSLASEDGASIQTRGQAMVAKRSASGTIAIKQFRPARVAPYLASYLVARIDEGSLDASARYRIDASGPQLSGHVDELTVRIEKLRTTLPSEKAALVGADAIALDGGAFDLGTRAFTAASLKLTAPVVAIKRDAKGNINLRAALVETAPASSAAATVRVPQTKAAGVIVAPETGPAFTAIVKTLLIERGDITFEDAATGRPVHVRAAPLNLKAENIGTGVGTSGGAVVPFDLSATIEQRGKLAAKGTLTLSPLMLDASIDANQVAVGWAVAYAGDRLNVNVESADLNARGTLRVEESRKARMAQDSTTSPISLTYRGSAGIVRLRALDKVTSEEFVRWKSLDIPKVDVQMPAKSAPIAVTLGNVTLTDFYARLIVNANGRLNVQDVIARPGERQSVTTPDSAPAPADEKQTTRESAATIATPASTAASGGPTPMIRVAGIKLVSGRIGVTDNFVKPNYSANLTDLNGDISAIASNDRTPADVHVLGRIDGDGSLDVSGKINLFAATAFTDISAEAKDIELTRLSPYAIKYAGYAIERGKLSMTVKYHIENGKLDAQNRLFLDQLTFGEKVDSPTATSLPVRLAVSLLKNSRGEINLNLPISGTLSDPQFSIGGVIWNAIVNILTRAVSAPFSLIASAAGGSGGAEQLGYVEFAPGVSDLAADAKKKLDTLAKALADRPQLKLDIIGRFDPVSDPEGIKRDHLLDRLKDLKAKDLAKPGAPIGRDDATIAPDEYARYLSRVYDDTKLPDKPRNLIGLAKTLPVEEMEKLLLATIKLDPNDPRWLAEARADVVRHYIEDTDKIDRSRVFLVQPKLNSQGIDDSGKPTRVDFALH